MCFLSVVVITCASHAQGRRFEPGRKQNYFFVDKHLPQDSPHLFYQIWYLGTKNKIDTVHTVTQTCMIFAYFEYLGYKSRFYGVMVSTLDFESSDPSSNLGRTSHNLTPWRNGSASDSKSEGCVFESRRGHKTFLLSNTIKDVGGGRPLLKIYILLVWICKNHLPPMRIELMTFGLQDQRSATEL